MTTTPARGRGAARTGAAALVLLAALLLATFTAPGARAQNARDAQGPPWGLTLKSAAVVEGDRVLLGEIADPYGDMPSRAWEKLAGFPLWESPDRRHKPVVLDRARLRRLLEHHLGDVAGIVSVHGDLTYQRGGSVVTEDDIRRLVNRELPGRLNLDSSVELRDLQAPNHTFLDGKLHHLELGGLDDREAGRVSIKVLARAPDGHELRSLRASVFVDAWATVPTAARPINRGEIVTPEMVTFERTNLAYLNGKAWDGRGHWRAARSIGEGRPLTMDELEPVPVIVRGEKVNLVFRGRNIKLSLVVEALEDGFRGERILVRNLQSNKKILATVVDGSTVEVK
jgi:flagella basal body P-ring formation protein FlgA